MAIAVSAPRRTAHALLRQLAPELPSADRVLSLSHEVSNHDVFRALTSVEDVQVFMEHHVWAVWDFMSLLKSVQSVIAPVRVPWRPPPDPAAARFINEIAAGEEGDEGVDGASDSHFGMYLDAMREAGADVRPVKRFVSEVDFGFAWEIALDVARPPAAAAAFVTNTLRQCARPLHERVAAFTLGREEVIPSMFRPIVAQLAATEVGAGRSLRRFTWYLERHMEVDGDHHGPLAAALLERVCFRTAAERDASLRAAEAALSHRLALWNAALAAIRCNADPVRSAG